MNDLTHANSEETLLSRLWRRARGVSEPNLRESIEDALDETEEEGTEFSLEERHMLRNLLGFRDVRVDDVMVPRADISAIDLATFGEDVLSVFVESGHSRLPVYRETLDSPVGMLHLKDVIAARREPAEAADIELIMRDVLFVPPSMPALDLLLKMQATRTHLALVIDEYGGTDGLVTIEDLIEEIVGDIEDEHDDVGAAPLRQTGAGVWRASARVSLETLE
ncbi:MAG: hemolysin family protein, partial [Pseudomonadota bacterium]|nr:hemolysin family protein [Pseudomonadota bacterium]